LVLLSQFRHDQFVAMVDKLSEKRIGHVAVYEDRVPLLLVHVPPWLDAVVLLAELDRSFGVAFQIDEVEGVDVS